MPSEEFMSRVLSTGRNDEIVEEEVEEVEPLDLAGVEEAAAEGEAEVEEEEEAPSEEAEEDDEEDEEAPEGEAEEEGEEATAEAEAAALHEDEFYLGRYKNREEAERGWLEKEQFISRQGDELQQLRQEMAEMRGYVQGSQRQSEPGEFEAWAEENVVSGNGWGGAHEALDAALQSGDPSYVDGYVEVWKEHDPFEAARFRTMVDTQIAQAQQVAQQSSQPPPPQAVLNGVWLSMAEEDDGLRDPEVAAQVGAALKANAALRGAATSGNPEAIRDAIRVARDGVRMQSARPAGSGTPRRVKSSDAERTAQAKLDASVTTGDSAPDRGNGSTPDVPPELQDMMGAIQRGEAGFPKLRE